MLNSRYLCWPSRQIFTQKEEEGGKVGLADGTRGKPFSVTHICQLWFWLPSAGFAASRCRKPVPPETATLPEHANAQKN